MMITQFPHFQKIKASTGEIKNRGFWMVPVFNKISIRKITVHKGRLYICTSKKHDLLCSK